MSNPLAVRVPLHQLSRLLYCNPVCLLTTTGADLSRNIMTISWLTPLDAANHIILSMNAKRFSHDLLMSQPPDSRRLVLSIPTEDQATLVNAVGSHSGRNGPKFPALLAQGHTLTPCIPGLWDQPPPPDAPLFAIKEAVAHLVVRVQEVHERNGHSVLFAEIEEAHVLQSHWDGRVLGPTSMEYPRILSFLGSRKFAAVQPMDLDLPDPRDMRRKKTET